MKAGYLYILTNKPHGVLYTGVTSKISDRIEQHKHSMVLDSFSARYNCKKLVYLEEFPTIEEAIVAEKRIKKWNRDWKIRIIEKQNPKWMDLSEQL